MIKANFSAYSTYITDSLHQWDINQVLNVTGLNLTTAPEVHFSNANLDRAIVRQATMTDHVVSVAIPNSLLQDPLRIKAHIGIYEGDTFKVVELVEIPVEPRKRPYDYQLEGNDEELYSFKRLENQVANAATKDQVANIVAGVTTDSELVDVRYGADGVTYPSAGEAVRGQNLLVQEKLADVAEKVGVTYLSPAWVRDKFIASYSTIESSNGYGYTEPFYVEAGHVIKVKAAGYSNTLAIISKVSEDMTAIERVVRSVDGTVQWYEYRATAPGYLSVSANITKPVVIMVDRDETALPFFDLALFNKFGVVGDSFASGQLYFNNTYTENYAISWGQILARKKGTICTNYSAGGLSTRTWLTHSKGLPALLANPAEDVYFLALGINDYGKLGESYIGTLADIANYADTFYGNYGKIIEQIMAHAPHAKLVMFTCASTDAVPALYNAAIVNIAEHYGIPYIVQAEDEYFSSEVYTTMAGGHPTAIGYAGMACAFERLLNKCVANNVEYFKDAYMY